MMLDKNNNLYMVDLDVLREKGENKKNHISTSCSFTPIYIPIVK